MTSPFKSKKISTMIAVMTLFEMGSSIGTSSSSLSSISLLTIPNAAAASTISADQDLDEKWKTFKTRHRKAYKNTQEDNNRRKIFKDNLARIEQLNNENEKMNGHRPFGVNEFSDLSPEEFATGYLKYQQGTDVRNIEPPSPKTATATATLPTSIDWTMKGATTPVKNQGNCGSCWAFSAVEQLETATFMGTGVLPVLSPQQVTSCSTTDSGCGGGDTVSAYSYMLKSGVQSETSYPYTSGTTGSTGSCNYNSNAVSARMSGWQYGVAACSYTDSSCSKQASLEPALQQAIVDKGPASVCLNATPWQYYTGGVMAANCASDLYSMNHCVQLVGYNTAADGSKYWILRNQWGTNWGIKGYIQLQMGSNMCGMANEVTYVTASGTPSPTPTVTPTTTPTVTPTPTPTVSPTPSPTVTPTPSPTPTITPSPSPTLLPPGQQEAVDFVSTPLGTSTICSANSTGVTCQTSLSTSKVSYFTSNSQLLSKLTSNMNSLRTSVVAIRPDYYSTLTCTLSQTRVIYGYTQKYMTGIAVCKH